MTQNEWHDWFLATHGREPTIEEFSAALQNGEFQSVVHAADLVDVPPMSPRAVAKPSQPAPSQPVDQYTVTVPTVQAAQQAPTPAAQPEQNQQKQNKKSVRAKYGTALGVIIFIVYNLVRVYLKIIQ